MGYGEWMRRRTVLGGLESVWEVGFGIWGYIGEISVDNESL